MLQLMGILIAAASGIPASAASSARAQAESAGDALAHGDLERLVEPAVLAEDGIATLSEGEIESFWKRLTSFATRAQSATV